MSRIPIRIRLTLAFVFALGIVLAGLGVVVYTRFEDSLNDNIDQALRSRATDIAAVIERSGPQIPGAADRFVESEESFAQILDSEGTVVDGSSLVDTSPLLSPEEVSKAREGSLTVERRGPVEADDPARLFAVPVDDFVLVVGQDIDDNEESLATLRLLLGVGLPIALVLASLAGYAVAAAALRPVEAMRRKAAGISEDQPGETLPLPSAEDEIRRLGETLNAMLARLETALERERGFVADASHELRTPLASLKTELELALRRDRTEDEMRAALRSASEETDRLSRLADDLLVLARSDRGTLPLRIETVLARELLDGVAAQFRNSGHDVQLDVPEGLELQGDRLRLEQAVGNLVANAATHGDGAVRVSACQRDGAVELHVEDEGEGLPPGFAEHAFERFTRADEARAGGGAGLGLAIVAAIARAHGGRAGFSPRDRGTDAWITLPLLIEHSSGAGTTAQ
jgi:two-component system, OmpR family, sensor kinase